jgi:FkbM family methyltransferase
MPAVIQHAITMARRVVARIIATPWMGLRLMRLAPDTPSALRNLLGVAAISWARTVGGKDVERPLFVASFGTRLALRAGDYSELQVIDEIFANDAYVAATTIQTPQVIVDLGSNIGASIAYFATRFPEALIYGFEPNPDVFPRLQANVKALPNVSVFPWAIGARDEMASLQARPHQSWSGSLGGDQGVNSTEVSVRSLRSIAEELDIAQIDLLKLDIEGAEFDAIESFPELSRIGSVVGEVHAPPDSQRAREWLARLQGFELALSPAKDGHGFGLWATQPNR